MSKLVDRINSYIDHTDYHLLPKLPVMIVLNGRSFNKISAFVEKPYSSKLMEALTATASRLIQEIEGIIFIYIFNDEIVILTRNDQTNETQPWYNNNIQKIVSTVSAIATLYFNNYSASINLDIAEATFSTHIFTTPNISEALNTFICKQQENLQLSVQMACFHELIKKGYKKTDIEEMTDNITREEKIELLLEKCQVDFNKYSEAFRYGVACYKKPQIIKYEDQEIVKSKWFLDMYLPIFALNQDFLRDIIKEK